MAKLTTAELNKAARSFIKSLGLQVIPSYGDTVAGKTACFSIRAGKIRIERHVEIVSDAGQSLIVNAARRVRAAMLLGLDSSQDNSNHYALLTDAQKKQIDESIVGYEYDEFTV